MQDTGNPKRRPNFAWNCVQMRGRAIHTNSRGTDLLPTEDPGRCVGTETLCHYREIRAYLAADRFSPEPFFDMRPGTQSNRE